MSQPKIAVTGANGQLGKELQVLSNAFPEFHFIFLSKEELPIQNAELVKSFFENEKPAFCINCAAYTAVDKAETERELAFLINAEAVGILAAVCKKFNTKLIHISTDYVFDGTSPTPYKESDNTNPISVYGASKLKGEQLCLQNNPDAIIIRTAWVYSAFGHNFVKTMLRLMKERKEISVVNDQIGAPTYAADLAQTIMQIVSQHHKPTASSVSNISHQTGNIFHYSNGGKISWFDFASEIKSLTGTECTVNPIPTSQYPTPARRPSFSLLNTEKIKHTFNISIRDWKDGLRRCLEHLEKASI